MKNDLAQVSKRVSCGWTSAGIGLNPSWLPSVRPHPTLDGDGRGHPHRTPPHKKSSPQRPQRPRCVPASVDQR